MKKFLLGIMALLVFNACTVTQTVVKPPSNVNMPQKALFISQSGTESNLLQTLIDLENNEMVVLTYNNSALINVIRTGIYLNPADYKNRIVMGTDAPFKEEVEAPKPIEKKEK